jgi:hypothetical protein
MANPNIELLTSIANAMGALREQVVFVAGAQPGCSSRSHWLRTPVPPKMWMPLWKWPRWWVTTHWQCS